MNSAATALTGALMCPTPHPNTDVSVRLLNTAWGTAKEQTVVAGGGATPVHYPFTVGVIEHPTGIITVDAGLGHQSRIGRYPFWASEESGEAIGPGMTLVEQLGGPPRTVLVTHMHADHISGLLDMSPSTTVWVTQREWESARTSNVAFDARRFERAVQWKPVPLEARNSLQMLGRPAMDVVEDGTVWYLSTPGHTPGSASVLVRTSTEVWLFIGDIAWVDEHLNDKRRPFLVSMVVDGRPRHASNALVWARKVREQCPSIHIIAGHEGRWFQP